ncbi:hypothetical protein FRC11_004600, partial [Ceratobasidium sp. 423]
MARRAAKPPRCTQCIERGRTSKCDRRNPCTSCVKSGTEALCSYDGEDPPLPPPPPPPSPPPNVTRGIRRPISRATPSNPSIPGRSTLSPAPSLPPANTHHFHQPNGDGARQYLREYSPLPAPDHQISNLTGKIDRIVPGPRPSIGYAGEFET